MVDFTFKFPLSLSIRKFFQIVSFLYTQSGNYFDTIELTRGDSEYKIDPPPCSTHGNSSQDLTHITLGDEIESPNLMDACFYDGLTIYVKEKHV